MLVIICIWKIKLSVGVCKTRLIGFIDPAIIKINIISTYHLMEAGVILEKRFLRCGAMADPRLPERVISGTLQLGNEYKCLDRVVLSTTLTSLRSLPSVAAVQCAMTRARRTLEGFPTIKRGHEEKRNITDCSKKYHPKRN